MRRTLNRYWFCPRRSSSALPPPEHSRSVARKESPFSPDWAPAFDGIATASHNKYETRWAVGQRRACPLTSMQALMEAAPHEDVEDAFTDTLDLRERLAAAVDALPQRQRWIFEAHHYRGLSFRQIARELSISKTTADRVYREALATMRERLLDA